jgi:hypothetical protein
MEKRFSNYSILSVWRGNEKLEDNGKMEEIVPGAD